ncbi:MAG: sugar phosphate isomerase/epimerase [Candidatus Aminicenantes bacterium]|nr:MAG: sugar phosphate isomerase/epimerase [Candidatus Aminicenantes bacterium]
MKERAVGIDNYCLYPLQLAPLEALKWAEDNGAEGIQFSGLNLEVAEKVDAAYLRDLSDSASDKGLYLEWGGGQHIPFDLKTWEQKDISRINQKAAEQAALLGTSIVRSCSGGLMRWDPQSPMTETLLEEMAKSLRAQRQMLMDNDVILAIETHFEFTTHELLRLFDRCGAVPGEYLGICLDTMNLLTMLENPLSATQRILPWVVCTHIKDGAVILDDSGLTSFPVEIGKGVIDLRKICSFFELSPRKINLTIEDHGGEFLIPMFDPLFLSKFPDLTSEEFAQIIRLALQTEKKIKNGDMEITSREEWPEICEARIKRDIQSLQQLL